jgi:uncharacterized membrane protein
MIWLGAIFGLLLGVAFQSIAAAILLALIGGVAGAFFRKESASLPLQQDRDRDRDVDSRLRALQEQLEQMKRRMALLEQKVGGELADTAPTASVQPGSAPMTPAAGKFSDAAPIPVERPIVSAAPAIPAAAETPTPKPRVVPAGVEAGTATPSKEDRARATVDKAAVATRPSAPSAFNTFVTRWVFGGNPIVKIGVLILFLGLAFLLRYAAEHAVLPVEWRYAGVAATGIGLLLFGWRWRHKKDNYGLILQGGGIAVLYLTTLAAMKLHPLIPPGFGFAILIAVAVFAALLAVLQDAFVLAVIGTIGGFAAPVLASTGSGNHVALFSYLAVLNFGILAIAWFKTWRALNLIGYVASFALGSAWAAKYYRDELFASTEPFLLMLFLLYVLITFLFARRTLAQAPENGSLSFELQVRQAASRVSYVDGTLAFGVPFSAFGLQYLLVKSTPYGAAYSALGFGLTYVVLALLLFRQTGRRYILLTETMIALGVIFGSLAIPLGLEQKWTAAAWAVEAAGVYWVGVRQQRLHARLFALLLQIGAAIYFALGLRIDDQGPVLDGSLLGNVMLAASTWWTYRLMRRAAPQLSGFEHGLRSCIIAFGAFFVALIPFLLWPMDWASPALAILGTAGVFIALRLSERPLLYCGWLYQAAAGALFVTTLKSSNGGSVLSNGWSGLLAASLIGASILAGGWAIMRHGEAGNNGTGATPRAFGGGASVALLAGLVFINLAPLFVLPWRLAAMVWPLSGLATLWWALRARHIGAILFALVLEAVAGFAHFAARAAFHSGEPDIGGAMPFMLTGFWGPVLIALAALTCARLLHRLRNEQEPQPLEMSLGWVALLWSGVWWAFAWTSEVLRVMKPEAVMPCLVGVAVASAWIASSIARRWNWAQLGQATLAYLPSLMAIAAAASMSAVEHPLASWGALAWPAALVTHWFLLRRQPAWISATLLDLAHIAGAWLFLAQSAIELRWQLAQWGDADSTWPLLGWMIAPVAYLGALTIGRVQRCWPIREHRGAYLVASAIPIVVYLLGWVWITNGMSKGTAAPLPYLPILNPLEIAQIAVLLGAGLWYRSAGEYAPLRGTRPLAMAVGGCTGFAILTGSVARTCHHWGQVAWDMHALFASNLVQTSLSVAWSIVAIGLMLTGNRSKQRWIWIVGAGLVAIVVAKLFLVELAARGSLTRIVSFIVVGMLLLLVGYFAPLPPRRANEPGLNEAEAVSP